MADLPLHPRFPSVEFISRAEFIDHERASATALREARLAELRIATRPWLAGTCAPCLRAMCFETGPDSARGWRGRLACHCEDKMVARDRAVLHLLQSVVGLSAWSRMVVFARPGPVERRLRALVPSLRTIRRLAFDCEGPASMTVVTVIDMLDHVPPLDAALASLRRMLIPGGRLVMTTPFGLEALATVSRLDALPRPNGRLPAASAAPVHTFGWDLLDRLRRAGFARAALHLCDSEEFGYLGRDLVVIVADA